MRWAIIPTGLRRIGRLLLAVVACAACGVGASSADDRPRHGEESPTVVLEVPRGLIDELESLKRQVDELRRSDSEKGERIRALERQVRGAAADELAVTVFPVLGRTLAPIALEQEKKNESALDRALRESERQESPLDRAVRGLGPQQESPLDRALRESGETPGPAAAATPAASARPAGPGQFQLMDISLDALFAAGTSTQKDASIRQLEGGDHDPHKRGFTVQNVELFLQGAVDPYLDGAANIVYTIDPDGDTVVELEEAYMTTRALPHRLQIKAGQFFTEFGRNNPQHPHSWQWIDQPVINTRLFGPDGMRGPGVRVSWLVPVHWFSEIYASVQNANGETMSSFFANDGFFDERPVGGRPFVSQDVRELADVLYTIRWENGWDTCDEQINWLLGVSGVFGPNATGPDGNTQVYGTDLTMKYRPTNNNRGWPFLIWESEFMMRRYVADNLFDRGDPLDPLDDIVLGGDTLRDWGLYTQVLWGFKLQWAAGLRYEFVTASGDSLDASFADVSHERDPFRDQRHRLAPLVVWYPSEFSRFRFQYNYDHAVHVGGKDAHSFWLGAEFLIGAHPAHKF